MSQVSGPKKSVGQRFTQKKNGYFFWLQTKIKRIIPNTVMVHGVQHGKQIRRRKTKYVDARPQRLVL